MLSQRTTWENSESYGAMERSGKLQVVTKVRLCQLASAGFYCTHDSTAPDASHQAACNHDAGPVSVHDFRMPQVLRAWHSQGHRALVFTQTQQMLDIVEKAVAAEGRRWGSGNTSSRRGRTTNILYLVPLRIIGSHPSTSQALLCPS